jgi:hypothetical protein
MMGNELFDMPCFPHIVNLVGERLELPNASRLLRLLCSLFSFSDAAKGVWRELAGSSFPSHSETRWYSLFDVGEYVVRNFPIIKDFLRQCQYGMFNIHVSIHSVLVLSSIPISYYRAVYNICKYKNM